MTALAMKLESVPSLNTSQLVLSDPSCGPAYSNDRYAYFVFTGSSCGTTRKVNCGDSLPMQMSAKSRLAACRCSWLTPPFSVFLQHDAV